MNHPRRGILLGAALLVAALGAFGASEHPDTLESFLERRPAAERSEPTDPLLPAPLPGGRMPGIESPGLAEFLAGAAGVLATFGLLTLVASLAAARRARRPESRAP